MFWVWITIMCLTFLTIIVKKNKTTIGFFMSSVITFLSYLLIKNFIIQLGIFVVFGVLCSFGINYIMNNKKEKK